MPHAIRFKRPKPLAPGRDREVPPELGREIKEMEEYYLKRGYGEEFIEQRIQEDLPTLQRMRKKRPIYRGK